VNYYKTQPPREFLLSASRNHAANLRKEIGALLDLWMEENSAAMLARWLMEQRERPQQGQQEVSSAGSLPRSGHAVSDNFFANHRSHCPQTEAPLEVKAIFRRSICTLQPALAPTKTQSLGPGGVPSVMHPSGFHSLAHAFLSNASNNRAWRLPSTSIAVDTSPRHSPDLRLSCLIFIRGR
jgi:hypothetical protein